MKKIFVILFSILFLCSTAYAVKLPEIRGLDRSMSVKTNDDSVTTYDADWISVRSGALSHPSYGVCQLDFANFDHQHPQYTNAHGEYVPYLNATGPVDLGTNHFTADTVRARDYIGAANEIYGSFLVGNAVGGIDMRGDPWYLSGVSFETAETITAKHLFGVLDHQHPYTSIDHQHPLYVPYADYPTNTHIEAETIAAQHLFAGNIEATYQIVGQHIMADGVYGTYLYGDGTYIENVPAAFLDIKVKAGEAIKKGQAVYVSGATGNNPIVSKAINTTTNQSRVMGIARADIALNAIGYVRRAGVLDGVDTRSTNADINPLGQIWNAGDLLFLGSTAGTLTNIRPTSGRSVKVAYNVEVAGASGGLLAYPMENPVWATAAASENVTDRLGDTVGANKLSVRNYTNLEVAYINSLGDSHFRSVAAVD